VAPQGPQGRIQPCPAQSALLQQPVPSPKSQNRRMFGVGRDPCGSSSPTPKSHCPLPPNTSHGGRTPSPPPCPQPGSLQGWGARGRGASTEVQAGLQRAGSTGWSCRVNAVSQLYAHGSTQGALDDLCGMLRLHTTAQTPIFRRFPSGTHLNPAPSPSWGWQVPPLAQGLEEQPLSATSQSLPWERRERWERAGCHSTVSCSPCPVLPSEALQHSGRGDGPAGSETRGHGRAPVVPPSPLQGWGLLGWGPPGPGYLVAAGTGAAVEAEWVVVASALVLAGAGEAGVALGLDAQGGWACGTGGTETTVSV